MHEYDPAALGLELKIHSPQSGQGVRNRLVAIRRSLQHQKPTRSGTQQLAADRPGLARLGIPLINAGRRDIGIETLLEVPAFMENFAKARHPIGL